MDIMLSTRKKSPLTTSKKKKLSSNKYKSKKSVVNIKTWKHGLTVDNTDRSYLNEVSQTTSNVGGESLNLQSQGAVPRWF